MARLPDRPDDLGALRAAALLDAGRAEQARAVRGPALSGEPDGVDGWGLLAQAHLDSGDAEAALSAAGRSQALDPHDPWSYRLASRALHALGRHADSVRAAEQAVQQAPGLWVNHALLALVASTDPARHLLAWDHATRCAELEPAEPGPHLVVGIVAHTGRHLPQARQGYATVLLLDPTNTLARRNLALLDLDRGRVRAAADGLHVAAAGDPSDAMARANAARVVDVLLGRLSWVTAVLLFLSAAVVGSAGRSPGTSMLCALLSVSSTVFVVGRVRLIDREGLLRLARTDRRLRGWACSLAGGAVLTALVGVSGSAVVGVAALVLLLVGPVWTMRSSG